MNRFLVLILLTNWLWASDHMHNIVLVNVLILLSVATIFAINSLKINKNKTAQNADKKQDATFFINQRIVAKTRCFDIRENLLYFFKTLNYDAAKNNNTVISEVTLKAENSNGEFETHYNFNADPEILISSMSLIVNNFINEVKNSILAIKLEMFNLSDMDANFNFKLTIKTNQKENINKIFNNFQDTDNKNSKLIKQMLSYIKGSEITIDKDNSEIGFNFTLSKCLDKNTNQIQTTIEYPTHMANIYITHDEPIIVELVNQSFENKQLNSVFHINLERFISFTHNPVYIKNNINVFFISTNNLKQIENTHKSSLHDMQKEKHMKIFAIAHNYNDIDYVKHKFPFIEILPLPYTNEFFDVIVNKIFDKY